MGVKRGPSLLICPIKRDVKSFVHVNGIRRPEFVHFTQISDGDTVAKCYARKRVSGHNLYGRYIFTKSLNGLRSTRVGLT